MSQETDLPLLSATEINALYRKGRASPTEVARSILSRMERLNPRLNAFCYAAAEDTLGMAAASAERWRRGEPLGPLDGVPVSIKDLMLVKGWPTLRGSRTIDPSQTWDIDAPSTARLREAGAVLLGKTATPEFGCKGETNSPLTGLTRNPWNLAKSPGGSSGGAAAAVAAGLGPLGLGTDGAGSVRIPAAFCGTFGLKPSFGRIPLYPLSPYGSVGHAGVHSMSVADAALAMNALKRPDPRDWTSLPYDDSDYAAGIEGGVRGLRIAWSKDLGYADVHPEIAEICERAAKTFEALGGKVEAIDPGFEDPLEISTGLWFLGSLTLWDGLTPAQREATDPDFAAQAELGKPFTALDIQRLNSRRAALGSHMRQFMEGYDLLLTPAVAVPAFDALPAGHSRMEPRSMLGWTPFTYPFNLTQQPACAIPCGSTSDGLPIGLQIVGGMFADALVLRAARAFEEAKPIPRPLVPLD